VAASKLPANRIIGEAFGFVFTNLRPLARAAAVPFGVMTLSLLRMIWAGQEGHMATYAVVLWLIIQFAATVPFQTQVYRFALGVTPDSMPRLGWPWGQRETMLVINAIGLMLVSLTIAAIVVGIVVALAPSNDSTNRNEALAQFAISFVLVGIPAMIVALYLSARLGLVLAAAAVGHATNWRLIWRATERNGWRIVWVMLVTILPWSAANGLIQMLTSTLTGVPALILLGTAANVIGLIGMAVPATALGLAYRHLVLAGGRPPSVSLLA
jgi:hypothetical protein